MTRCLLTRARWDRLESSGNDFTCYSAALAVWLAGEDDEWPEGINPGLWIRVIEEPGRLFGFSYFPPALPTRLGLVRTGADHREAAMVGVLAELEQSGRVIVAADGFNLPWHVAAGRRHLPHWFVLVEGAHGLEIADPFTCRNELGIQTATRARVTPEELATLLRALPGEDPVHRLREVFALGDYRPRATNDAFQWFVRGVPAPAAQPGGLDGSEAIRRLATHFRDHGEDPQAYAQADDIWSIARHRGFLCRHAGERAQARADLALDGWVSEHATPLVKQWSHMAPLLMQAQLRARAGRSPSTSVPDTLDRLAELENVARWALEEVSSSISGQGTQNAVQAARAASG